MYTTQNFDKEAMDIITKMSLKEKERFNTIIAMNIMVTNMNDETAYMTWINLVPDCATEWVFIDFATNDEGTEENQMFDEAVELFKKLWDKYAKEDKGLYIGGKCY